MQEVQVSIELLAYAARTINKKNTCQDAAVWLKEKSYSLESYFIALKHGALDNERYNAVADDFKAKYKTILFT